MPRIKPERMDYLEKGAAFGKPREAPVSGECNKRVALEFAAGDLEQALEKILEERYPFEFIGQRIIILPKDAADKLKKFFFKCKELEIIPLSSLPRNEANQIRKRHLK